MFKCHAKSTIIINTRSSIVLVLMREMFLAVVVLLFVFGFCGFLLASSLQLAPPSSLFSTCVFSQSTLSTTCTVQAPDFKCGVDNATGEKLGVCN